MSGLAEALIAFQANMPSVHKGKTANVRTKDGGSYKYTYADLADVTKEGMPLLSKNGLAFSCRPQRLTDGNYELKGVLLHTSGEKITGTLPIGGRTPQELGSSLTYARRYLFGCLTGIVTDDDDDAGIATAGESRQKPQPDEPARTTRTMSRAKKTAQPPLPEPEPEAQAKHETTPAQRKMHALFNQLGITDREERLQYTRTFLGRDISSSNELSQVETWQLVDALERDAQAIPSDGEPSN